MSDDVSNWLDEIGLSQYAPVFAENDLDWSVLPDLDNETLKDIGIASAGHRLRLLKAAKALGSNFTDVAPANDAVSDQSQNDANSNVGQTQAERRQLTVMFCDLVDSTALSASLDPEELREVIRAFQHSAAQVIAQYDGHIAQYLGDGLLVYFGFPLAHEDDAARAIHAGLGIPMAIGELNQTLRERHNTELVVRVGIHTGPVVVGEMGSGDRHEDLALGETVNLAARLEASAQPNTVYVSSDTHRLTRGLFQWNELPELTLKGIPRPVQAWQALGATAAESRFLAMYAPNALPLVGRNEEAALLRRYWDRACEGEGHAVVISGEAGIGKSRLLETLGDDLGKTTQGRISHQCSPYHTSSAFYPIADRLEREAGVSAQDTAEVKGQKLKNFLDQSRAFSDQTIPLILSLSTVVLAEIDPPSQEPPQLRKERTLQALVNQIRVQSAVNPVLLIFEDVHWIDPSSRALIDLLVDVITDLPVLMVLTSRPGFAPDWQNREHVATIELKRISKLECRQLLQSMSGSKTLQETTLDEIIDKSNGIPLYVEEVARSVLETVPATDLQTPNRVDVSVPGSLRDSLVSRLDRLTVGKPVAQMGSVIGREFSQQLLAQVSDLSDKALVSALDELVMSGLLLKRGTPADPLFSFRHALLQDCAYGTILLAERKRLHRQVAEALSGQAQYQPAVVAHHWAACGELLMAFQCRQQAAEKSVKVFAISEAVSQYLEALDLLVRLPATPDTREKLVRTVFEMSAASFAPGDINWESDAQRDRAIGYIDRAIEIVLEGDRLAMLARLLSYKGRILWDEALIAEGLGHAEESGDASARAEVNMRFAVYFGYCGRFDAALKCADRAADIFTELGQTSMAGIAIAGAGRCFNARSGFLSRSVAYAQRASELAESTDDTRLRAWGAMQAEALYYMGRWEETIDVVLENLPTAQRIGSGMVVLFSSAWAAMASIKLGGNDQARTLLDDASTFVGQVVGLDYPRAYHRMAVAELNLAKGEATLAMQNAERALDMATIGSYRLEQGAAYRVIGQIQSYDDNSRAAEKAFESSLGIFRSIQASPELAQTMLAYGKFLNTQRSQKSDEVLYEAIEIFEEIGAPGWVAEARAALSSA